MNKLTWEASNPVKVHHVIFDLPKPKSQTTDILYWLINSKAGISERDFQYNGFRSRISELREYLNIKETLVSFKNKFKHKGQFKRHWITDFEKPKAIRLYQKLIKLSS